MFKNENSFSNIQMYSGNSECSRLFLTEQSDQSLNASQHPAIVFLRRENQVNSIFQIVLFWATFSRSKGYGRVSQ